MIKHRFFLFFIFLSCLLNIKAQYSNSVLGQWRDHLSYYSTNSLNKTENKILVGSESSLFYYSPLTNECERCYEGACTCYYTDSNTKVREELQCWGKSQNK